MKSDEVLRVTARKDRWDEVEDLPDGQAGFICNDCRFEKKKVSDWTIEGPSRIDHHSVISQNKYEFSKLRLYQTQIKKLQGQKADLGEGPLNPNNA
jgi:hypothetical protein